MANPSAPENEKQGIGTLLSLTKTRFRDSHRQLLSRELPAKQPEQLLRFRSRSGEVEIPLAGLAGGINDDGATWYCDCHPRQKAILRVVTSQKHKKGRSFWKCSRADCSFFRWADEPAPASKPATQLQTPDITPPSRTNIVAITDENLAERVRQTRLEMQQRETCEQVYTPLGFPRRLKEMPSSGPTAGANDLSPDTSAVSITDDALSTDDEDSDPIADQKLAMLQRLMQHFHAVWAVCPVSSFAIRDQKTGAGSSSASASNASQQTGLAGSSNHSSSSRTTPPSSRKRSSKDQGDDGKGTKRPRGMTRNLPNETTSERFACPFFKRNPERYRGQQTCPGPGWLTVHRAKEHVYRRHSLPISCPRCHEIFATDRLKDQHIGRAQRCELREQAPAEGMDATQEKLLRSRKKTHKCMSDAEKWHEMYLALFPDTDPLNVPSPYYDYAATDGAAGSSESEMARYERFLRQQMPAQVRQELETRIEERLKPLEENLRRELVGIVADVQLRLFEMYRTMHAASGATDDAVATSRPSPSPDVPDEAEMDDILSGGYEPLPVSTDVLDAPELYGAQDFDGLLFDFSEMEAQASVEGLEPAMSFVHWDDLQFMQSLEDEKVAEDSKGKGKETRLDNL